MKKSRIIFFAIFGVYHVILVIITLYVKSKQQDYLSLLNLLPFVSLFVVGALLGLILVLIDFIWTWRSQKQNTDSEEALVLENKTLKAKLYDLQEAPKLAPPAAK